MLHYRKARSVVVTACNSSGVFISEKYTYLHLYSPRNMVAQANKTASKRTTNERSKNIMTVPLNKMLLKCIIIRSHYNSQPDTYVRPGSFLTSFLLCQLWSLLDHLFPDRTRSAMLAVDLHKWWIVSSEKCPSGQS